MNKHFQHRKIAGIWSKYLTDKEVFYLPVLGPCIISKKYMGIYREKLVSLKKWSI